MSTTLNCSLALLIMLGLATAGCGSKPAEQAAESGHEEHEHPSAGPHGGELIELGNEEYHAEIVHENEAVVYLLDGAAKSAVAIDAPEMVLNLSHDGKAEQFKLSPSRDAQDPQGKASRFTANDPELVADLKEGHAEVQLVVTINGTQFRGKLEHEHEGEGEEH